MEKMFIVTGGVTSAMHGRDILQKKGYAAEVEKNTKLQQQGCGFGISVSGDRDEIIAILKNSDVSVKRIFSDN